MAPAAGPDPASQLKATPPGTHPRPHRRTTRETASGTGMSWSASLMVIRPRSVAITPRAPGCDSRRQRVTPRGGERPTTTFTFTAKPPRTPARGERTGRRQPEQPGIAPVTPAMSAQPWRTEIRLTGSLMGWAILALPHAREGPSRVALTPGRLLNTRLVYLPFRAGPRGTGGALQEPRRGFSRACGNRPGDPLPGQAGDPFRRGEP